MNTNEKLRQAHRNKKDEFYTQLVDIENELRHYKDHFKGKTVYCNCDDPRVSNFFKYFSENFEILGLKKLITTCYKSNDLFSYSRNDSDEAICLIYEGDKNENLEVDDDEVGVQHMKGDGDFRSKDCIELLKEADIVVTNPPFSLFREYVSQLMDHGKKFLVIGHQNALGYKDIFPLIQNNKIWLGYGFRGGAGHFFSSYENYATAQDKQEGMVRVSGVHWFTNMDHDKRHEELVPQLYKEYNPLEYPHYENYDAINVDKVKEIPKNWEGKLGVPITFLDKFNPKEFEILGLGIANLGLAAGVNPYTKEHRKYRTEVQERGAVNGDLYMMDKGKVKVPYSRILIKRRAS